MSFLPVEELSVSLIKFKIVVYKLFLSFLNSLHFDIWERVKSFITCQRTDTTFTLCQSQNFRLTCVEEPADRQDRCCSCNAICL